MNTQPPRVVEAAGGIPYRWNAKAEPDEHNRYKGLEVCLVHRPKYDDWSWPKGKLEEGESKIHAAVREIEEESGTAVMLGPTLGQVEYALGAEGQNSKHTKAKSKSAVTIKRVTYWMAQPISSEEAERRRPVLGPIRRAKQSEVDDVIWLSVPKARKKLSHSIDRDVLDQFVARVEDGALNAHPLIIVRHGKAEPRKRWNGTDADRPITPRGAAASYALGRELACFNPSNLVSSPWLRCMETIESYAWHTGLSITTAPELTEDAFADSPQAAWQRIEQEIETTLGTECGEDGMFETGAAYRSGSTLICLHRPVIGGIFEHLRTLCRSKMNAKQLVAKSPYMATGNAVALFLVRTPDGPRIIDIQRMAPLVY